jgi:hypothetical protein
MLLPPLEDSKTIPFKKKTIIQKFSKYSANINNQLKAGLSKEKQYFYVLIKIQAQHNITPKQISNIIKTCKGELGCASWTSPPRLEEFYTFKVSLITVSLLCFSFVKFSFTTLKAQEIFVQALKPSHLAFLSKLSFPFFLFFLPPLIFQRVFIGFCKGF